MTHLTVIDWVPPPAHYIQNIEYICMFTEDTIQDSVIWPEKKKIFIIITVMCFEI